LLDETLDFEIAGMKSVYVLDALLQETTHLMKPPYLVHSPPTLVPRNSQSILNHGVRSRCMSHMQFVHRGFVLCTRLVFNLVSPSVIRHTQIDLLGVDAVEPKGQEVFLNLTQVGLRTYLGTQVRVVAFITSQYAFQHAMDEVSYHPRLHVRRKP
jgi:hypothetical protein